MWFLVYRETFFTEPIILYFHLYKDFPGFIRRTNIIFGKESRLCGFPAYLAQVHEISLSLTNKYNFFQSKICFKVDNFRDVCLFI